MDEKTGNVNDASNDTFRQDEQAARRAYEEGLERYRIEREVSQYLPEEASAESDSRVARLKQHQGGGRPSGSGWFARILFAVLWMVIGGVITAFFIVPAAFPNAYSGAAGVSELPRTTPAPQATAVLSPQRTLAPLASVDSEKLTLGGSLPEIYSSNNPIVEIADNYEQIVATVNVVAEHDDSQYVSGGSGFVISEDGYIMTNAHVVADAVSVYVVLAGEEYEARLVGSDATLDVAVLKIEATKLVAAPIGNSDAVRTGELAIAIGNPFGLGQSLTGTVTVGFISSARRTYHVNGRSVGVIQTDAAINPGNSGGPLVNSAGEVVGITNMKTFIAGVDDYGNTIATEGLGFSIPINEAMDAARQLITSGSVLRPGIGIYYNTITNTDGEITVLIESVIKGSPAEKAGLEAGDVVIKCDGKDVGEYESLSAYLSEKKVGDKLKFVVMRDRGEIEVLVEVCNLSELE